MEEALDEARAYVGGNVALRQALGLVSDDALSVEPWAAGEHNANFLLLDGDGRRFVLRINYASQLGLSDQIGYEAAALRALAASGRVPEVLYVDRAGTPAGRGVLVESFMEGSWLDFEEAAQLHEAACVLADVHAAAVPDDTPLLRPTDPLRAQLESCEAFFGRYRSSALAEDRVVRMVERLIGRAEEALRVAPAPSPVEVRHVLNTEAVPSHFLIDGAGRGGMVDWEKPVVGEVAQDVAYFLSPTTTIWDTDFVFDAAGRARFVADYWEAVDGRFPRGLFDARLAAYAMANALVGVTWSCNAWVEYHDPARPLKNDKTRAKLPIYLSEEFLDFLWREIFAPAAS